jgi:serine/threonine protein kinase
MSQQTAPEHKPIRWSDPAIAGAGALAPAEVGPLGLVPERRLGRRPVAERWLLRDPSDGAPFLGYRLTPSAGPPSGRGLQLATEILTGLRHRHILSPIASETTRDGGRWLVARFPGDYEGLRRLTTMLGARPERRLEPLEAAWIAQHTLAAIRYAHERGVAHGQMTLDDLVVDRRGGVMVELYGVARRLRDRPVADEHDRADEIRSAMGVVFQALTGSPWDDERPDAIELALDRAPWLGAWLETGLCSLGFATADEALEALERSSDLSAGRVGLLGRLRRWLAA